MVKTAIIIITEFSDVFLFMIDTSFSLCAPKVHGGACTFLPLLPTGLVTLMPTASQ
jgi:hypothetical protein